MLNKLKKNPSPLDAAIDEALKKITNSDPATAEYKEAVDQIVKLHKLKEATLPSALTRDTILLCVTNIAGIAMVIKHEHFNVITSKAFGFIIKPK